MKARRIFNIMNVISWVVFIGFCIKAGAIIIVASLSLFVSKSATENLYMGIDLSNLYDFSVVHFTFSVLFLVCITILKAYLFYVLIRVFKIIDLKKPFNIKVVALIFSMSRVALGIGILGIFAKSYSTWLMTKVFFVQMQMDTAAYIFMAGVIFIVAALFKQAIAIQQENELTI